MLYCCAKLLIFLKPIKAPQVVWGEWQLQSNIERKVLGKVLRGPSVDTANTSEFTVAVEGQSLPCGCSLKEA